MNKPIDSWINCASGGAWKKSCTMARHALLIYMPFKSQTNKFHKGSQQRAELRSIPECPMLRIWTSVYELRVWRSYSKWHTTKLTIERNERRREEKREKEEVPITLVRFQGGLNSCTNTWKWPHWSIAPKCFEIRFISLRETNHSLMKNNSFEIMIADVFNFGFMSF